MLRSDNRLLAYKPKHWIRWFKAYPNTVYTEFSELFQVGGCNMKVADVDVNSKLLLLILFWHLNEKQLIVNLVATSRADYFNMFVKFVSFVFVFRATVHSYSSSDIVIHMSCWKSSDILSDGFLKSYVKAFHVWYTSKVYKAIHIYCILLVLY